MEKVLGDFRYPAGLLLQNPKLIGGRRVVIRVLDHQLEVNVMMLRRFKISWETPAVSCRNLTAYPKFLEV